MKWRHRLDFESVFFDGPHGRLVSTRGRQVLLCPGQPDGPAWRLLCSSFTFLWSKKIDPEGRFGYIVSSLDNNLQ
jgi:hypothetical protein